ncbi:hypothetical protein [Cypionkella sp.]|uniref:hypothetical protein n=1 Tax=Cypionkella sp. TaxID=2811411 RepID=UPI002636D8BF|nr:hypothetical protein [Cypionkella sp.]MDB5665254.1 hypothetical protein [Cypionkella sp.]
MTLSSEKSRKASYEAARLARLERALTVDPDDRKLRLQVSAAKKRADFAQQLFLESLSIDHDVIDYRIVQASQRYSLDGIAESLMSFQSALTAIYDSLTSGPKERANYSANVKETTRLGFGYSYPGSVGFVLTIQSQQDLFGGALDDTSAAIEQFFEIDNLNDAIVASRTLGLGAISEMYRWVRSNATHGNSIDLNWRHSRKGYSGRFIDLNKFQFLERLFAGAEEREVKSLSVEGILVGLDVQTKRFHFVQPGGDSYKGKLGNDFGGEPKEVPSRYIAEISIIETRTPATGKLSIEYELFGLSLIN